MLEAYQALRRLPRHDGPHRGARRRRRASRRIGDDTVSTIEGERVDLAPPWRRATMAELIKRARRASTCTPSMPLEEARAIADGLGVEWNRRWGAGKIIDEVYDELVEAKLSSPTFVLDHPREISPLAQAAPRRPGARRALRGLRRRARAGQRLQRAQRPDRPARALRGRGAREGGRATTRPATSTRTTSARSSTACRPRAASGIGIDRLVMLLAGAATIRDVHPLPDAAARGRGRRRRRPAAPLPARARRAAGRGRRRRVTRRCRHPTADASTLPVARPRDPSDPRAARSPARRPWPAIIGLLAALPGLHRRLGPRPSLGARRRA